MNPLSSDAGGVVAGGAVAGGALAAGGLVAGGVPAAGVSAAGVAAGVSGAGVAAGVSGAPAGGVAAGASPPGAPNVTNPESATGSSGGGVGGPVGTSIGPGSSGPSGAGDGGGVAGPGGALASRPPDPQAKLWNSSDGRPSGAPSNGAGVSGFGVPDWRDSGARPAARSRRQRGPSRPMTISSNSSHASFADLGALRRVLDQQLPRSSPRRPGRPTGRST